MDLLLWQQNTTHFLTFSLLVERETTLCGVSLSSI
jgi:hypothetical protein